MGLQTSILVLKLKIEFYWSKFQRSHEWEYVLYSIKYLYRTLFFMFRIKLVFKHQRSP